MVPFEIVACTQILEYWGTSEKLPAGVIIAICIVLYASVSHSLLSTTAPAIAAMPALVLPAAIISPNYS
jgi:hypothetical protein